MNRFALMDFMEGEGLRLTDLSDRSGVSISFLSELRSGAKTEASPATVKKIARALNVRVRSLAANPDSHDVTDELGHDVRPGTDVGDGDVHRREDEAEDERLRELASRCARVTVSASEGPEAALVVHNWGPAAATDVEVEVGAVLAARVDPDVLRVASLGAHEGRASLILAQTSAAPRVHPVVVSWTDGAGARSERFTVRA